MCHHLLSKTAMPMGPHGKFFDKYAEAGVCDFLLIGDDALPPGLLWPSVNRA